MKFLKSSLADFEEAFFKKMRKTEGIMILRSPIKYQEVL